MEFLSSEPAISVQAQIEVLLHEYDNVAGQILHRYDAQFQAIGVYGAVFVGIIAAIFRDFRSSQLILLSVSTIIFIAVMLWIANDITRQGEWLRGLESEINRQAGTPLLRWELTRGFFGMTRHDAIVSPRVEPPPRAAAGPD